MFSGISDYLNPKRIDFPGLRNEIVTGIAYQPSFGRHDDLQQQLAMLEREFVGQIRLKFVHAVLNVLLRRGMKPVVVYMHFGRLWSEHSDILLDTLDTRWLVSACDTIADHSSDRGEARTAALISLFANTVKLAETERIMTGIVAADPARIRARTPIFNGMTAFMPEGGDMIANLLTRIDRTLQPDNIASMIGREIISRALSTDTIFSRFSRLQRRFPWRNYLSQVLMPEYAAPRQQVLSSADGKSPGYIFLNDTGRLGYSFHMGTLYACNAIRQNLARRGLTEIGWANDRAGFDALLAGATRPASLLVLNGEGTLHHGASRAEELLAICRHGKDLGLAVAVINSVWEDNPDTMVDALRTVDYVQVRDNLCLESLPAGLPADVAPDVSIPLFRKILRHGDFPPPRHLMAVMDSVVPQASAALLDFAEREGLPFYVMPLGNLRKTRSTVSARSGPVWPRLLQLTDLMGSRAWVTGRFHGLLAALCAGLPVCAVGSNTAKVEGFLRDGGLDEACLLSRDWLTTPVERKREELVGRLEIQQSEAFIERRDAYLETAVAQIDRVFDIVADLGDRFSKVNVARDPDPSAF